MPRDSLRKVGRNLAVLAASTALAVATPALAFVTPAHSELPNTSSPTVRLNHTVRTTPFAASTLSMKDNEGSAYVPRDNSLWLADDNGRMIDEIDATTGELKRSIDGSELGSVRQLGDGPQAGGNRVRDLESLAYDADTDTLYVFSGSCCSSTVLPTVFRLSRQSDSLELDSFQPLPGGTDNTAAAWNSDDGTVYVAVGTNIRSYTYTTNTLGSAFQVSNLSGILGMTFSPDGADLFVVRSSTKLSRVDWATRSLVPGWTLDLSPFGMRDTRAVELINDQFWVSDGYDGRADTDPLRDAVFVFDVPGSTPTSTTPTAAFTASSTSGQAPVTVTFTDTTTGGPTSRLWSFGDGQTSTSTNPSHDYLDPGTYTVTLTASNANGETSASTQITVNPAPPAQAATSWTATAASHGYPTRLRATLRNRKTGDALGNRAVVAQVRWYGTDAWRSVGTGLATNSAGTVVYRHRTTRAGHFRFSYAGTPALSRSTSARVFVHIPTTLSARTGMRRPTLVRGTLSAAAGIRIGGEKVRLQRRYTGQGKWVTVARVTSDRHGHLVSRQRPNRPALYRWAYPGSATSEPARSKGVKVPPQ